MLRRRFLFAAALLSAAPAAAQYQSESYQFLEAVRNSKGDDVIAFLSKPGITVVNARDRSTGEGALHIVVKRGDDLYMRVLLQKGADPNIRDGQGNTPIILAVVGGYAELVDHLLAFKANVNLANNSGETALIRAVQRRDLDMVRRLIEAGADPDAADRIAGMSARDYARVDTRSPAIAKLLQDAPKGKPRGEVAGPSL